LIKKLILREVSFSLGAAGPGINARGSKLPRGVPPRPAALKNNKFKFIVLEKPSQYKRFYFHHVGRYALCLSLKICGKCAFL